MTKKRKKRLSKSCLRGWYRACALMAALAVALAVPVVGNADSVQEVNYEGKYNFVVWDNDWIVLYQTYGSSYLGDYVNCTVASPTAGIKFRSVVTLGNALDNSLLVLLSAADSVSMQVLIDDSLSYDPSNISLYENSLVLRMDTGAGVVNSTLGNFNSLGLNSVTYDFGTSLKGKSIVYFEIYQNHYANCTAERLYNVQYRLSSFKVIFTLTGIDGATSEIVIQMQGMQDSIDQGFDQIGDQISGVQGDINSGFSDVNQNLGNIQNDLNTGFDNVAGAINGDGADTSGMDSGLSNLGGQLGDLGEIEDQLGGAVLDKIEVPDLTLTEDQGGALALLISCLNLAYVELSGTQVMFAAVLFFGIVGVLLFGRRNL